jgi:U1 small nuclear ribonucleoprotein 70kDa
MTDKLPPQLLALFAPRPPLRYLPPSDTAPEKRKTAGISGLAKFISSVAWDDDGHSPTETEEQKKIKRREAKVLRQEKYLREGTEHCTALF